MIEPGVGRVAMALGFLGLLPQLGATGLIAVGETDAALLALFYPLLILSFLGGIWWGFAMRREEGQGELAVLAITPSLAALALFITTVASLATMTAFPWLLIATGSAVLLTLPVDRHLSRRGEVPGNWMRLRTPLSVGLGGLTIASGILLHLRS